MSSLRLNHDNLKGPLFMLLSCVLFSIMGGLIRYLSLQDFHPFMTAFIRTIIAIMVLSPTFYKVGLAGLNTARFKLHFLRGTASGIAVICSFYAVTKIPLADATSYTFVAPLITTVLAVFFLKEKIHLPRITSLIIGFIGVLIVLRPGMTEFSIGIGAALLTAFSIAIAITCIRALSHTEKPNVIAVYSLLITLPFSFIFALFQWSWPTTEQWQILILIGSCAAIAQFSISKAFGYSEATALMPVDFTRLLFASIIGFIYFDETPDLYTFLGASIILSSAIYAAHREAKKKIIKPLVND